MQFNDKLDELLEVIQEKGDFLENEENTKELVILPLFQLLGYKHNQIIFNIQFGNSSKEKLDIAIYKNDKIITFLKVYKFRSNLDHTRFLKISEQFNQYKKNEKFEICILTNGYEYKFYSDYKNKNILDDSPFLSFNLFNIDEDSINLLKLLQSKSYDQKKFLDACESKYYSKQFFEYFEKNLKSPDTEFLRFITKRIYTKKLSESRFDNQFKKEVHNAYKNFVNKDNNVQEYEEETIETTRTELAGYRILLNILKKTIDLERVIDLDNPYYFAVLLDEDPDKPICNFHFNDQNNLKIGIFDKENKEKKFKLKNVDEIHQFKEKLIEITKYQDNKLTHHEGRFKSEYNTKWGIYSGECIEIKENSKLLRVFDGKGILKRKDGSIFYGIWKMNKPWNVKYIDKNKKPIYLISNGKKIG